MYYVHEHENSHVLTTFDIIETPPVRDRLR